MSSYGKFKRLVATKIIKFLIVIEPNFSFEFIKKSAKFESQITNNDFR